MVSPLYARPLVSRHLVEYAFQVMSVETINCVVIFFKPKTAYEMRISDWSSDVCSSDLSAAPSHGVVHHTIRPWTKKAQSSPTPTASIGKEIGRASCRERVCQYV